LLSSYIEVELFKNVCKTISNMQREVDHENGAPILLDQDNCTHTDQTRKLQLKCKIWGLNS
jgi:hypothetical protein